MKFSIFIVLGLFAFSAADVISFDEIPEVQLIQFDDVLPQGISFPTYVVDYFKNIVDQMNIVISGFKSIVNDDKQEIEMLSQAVQMDAMSKIDEILKKIQEIMSKGGEISKCAAKEEVAIKEVVVLVGDGIKICAQDMIDALKGLSVNIIGKSNELLATVNELKEIVKYCMSKGAIGKAFCITGNLTKGLRLVKKVIADAQSILAELQANSGELIAAAKDCNNNHIQVIFNKIKVIKNNVEVCVQNS